MYTYHKLTEGRGWDNRLIDLQLNLKTTSDRICCVCWMWSLVQHISDDHTFVQYLNARLPRVPFK